ncbi:hypothetical protein [Streptomyces anulatus]|uniref:hypothetical protein n=1 Tax=Streptomyces anulatus TaxID=1892 RepID=UPI003867F86E
MPERGGGEENSEDEDDDDGELLVVAAAGLGAPAQPERHDDGQEKGHVDGQHARAAAAPPRFGDARFYPGWITAMPKSLTVGGIQVFHGQIRHPVPFTVPELRPAG